MRHSSAVTVADILCLNQRIGRLRVDPTQVRGEGGALNPTLVMSLTSELDPQPVERRVALTEVRAQLSIGGEISQGGTRLGPPARIRRAGGPDGVWTSSPSVQRDDYAELRFPLSGVDVRLLESASSQQSRLVELTVGFEAEAALVRAEHEGVLGTSAMEFAPLAWVRVADVKVPVPRSEWAEQILPGLGLDSMRLVMVRLPRRGGPLEEDLAAWFDQARLKLDAGDYRGAIERVRDVRNAVERRLEATKAEPVAAKIQAARGLPDNAPSVEFLDGVWTALADMTNEAHHPDRPDQRFIEADARAVLLASAVALEYLEAALSPRGL